jgi:uncharacterized membrane protein
MTSLEVARHSFSEILLGQAFNNHTPPFYYLVLHLWLKIVPASEFGLRSLSVIFDMAAQLSLYFLTIKHLSRRIALISTFLYAVSPFLVYYAQEGRMYSLLLLICLLCWHLTNRAIEKRSLKDAALLALLLVAGLYTHYYFPFFVAGLFISAVGFNPDSWQRLRTLVLPCVFAAVLFIPWLPYVFELASSGGQEFRKFHHEVIPYTLFRFVAGYGVLPIIAGYKSNILESVQVYLPIIVTLALMIAPVAISGLIALRSSALAAQILGTLIIPAALAWLVSFKVAMLSERYLIVSYPAFILILAAGTDFLFRRFRVFGASAAVALLLALSFHYLNPQNGKADWRGAAEFLRHNTSSGSPIAVNPHYSEGVFRFYYGESEQFIAPEGLQHSLSSAKEVFVVQDGVADEFVNKLDQSRFLVERLWHSPFDNGLTVFRVLDVTK